MQHLHLESQKLNQSKRLILEEKKCIVILEKEASIDMRGTQKEIFREFPGGLVVRIWRFHYGGPGLIPGQHPACRAAWPKYKNK